MRHTFISRLTEQPGEPESKHKYFVNSLKIGTMLLMFFFINSQLGYSQYFRSALQTGTGTWLWNDPTSWQYSTDVENWGTTTLVPNSTNCELVYIVAGTTITITDSQTASSLFVEGSLIIEASKQLEVTGNTEISSPFAITIKSNATGSGAMMSGSFTNTSGSMKIERFMSLTNNLHLFSSPLVQTLNDFIKNNPEIPDLYDSNNIKIGVGMRDYSTSGDIWNSYMVYKALPKSPTGNIVLGKGYSVRTIQDGATANAGMIVSIGLPDPDNTITYPLDLTGKRWNFMGNPFTCALSVSAFLSENGGALEDSYSSVYLWDTNGLLGAQGQYVPINNASTASSIQLGQGFFVKAKTAGTGTISYTPAMRTFDATQSFKSAQAEYPTIKLLVKNNTLSVSSTTQFKFISNTTKGLDPGYDAGLLKSIPEFAIYSKLEEDNGVDFMLQCLPDNNYDQNLIPIGIDCAAGGELTFTAETINLPSGCKAILEDKQNRTFTSLDQPGASYTATVAANTLGTGRFYLHTADIVSAVEPLENQKYKITTIDHTLYINGEVSNTAQFAIYSINGKLLANFKAEDLQQNHYDASGLPAGVYIVRINDKNSQESTKFVLGN